MNSHLYNAKENLEQSIPGYQLLYKTTGTPQAGISYYVPSKTVAVELITKNIQPEYIFAATDCLSDADLRDLYLKCRFIAGSLDELQRIDKVVSQEAKIGQLASVGLRLIPADYDDANQQGVHEADLICVF